MKFSPIAEHVDSMAGGTADFPAPAGLQKRPLNDIILLFVGGFGTDGSNRRRFLLPAGNLFP